MANLPHETQRAGGHPGETRRDDERDEPLFWGAGRDRRRSPRATDRPLTREDFDDENDGWSRRQPRDSN